MWRVIGHSEAIGFLKGSIERHCLSHAYLLIGPARVGKTTLAKEFAKALNCQGSSPPCGECRSCTKIDAGLHPDVQVVGLLQDGKDGEEKQKKAIGIDQVRTLRRDVYLPPYEGRRKVYIFERAELLTTEAANALLKTLEEPPPNVVLILLAANDKLILPTVVSRCQAVRLHRPPLPVIRETLEQSWSAPQQRAELLARVSGGLPGKAIAALQDDNVWQEREETMRRIEALLQGDHHDRFDYANRLANTFGKNREAAYETLGYWLSWWRDLLLIKGGCPDHVANLDCEVNLSREAGRFTLRQIVEFIGKIRSTMRHLDANSNPRLALEVLMLGLPSD